MSVAEQHGPGLDAAQRGRAVRRVLWVTLALNVVVSIAKLSYGTLTHALSLRADGFHSLTDGSNNVLGLLGMWWALRPPDSKHPYGHEKIEVLSASAIGASLLLVAWNLVTSALTRLREGGVPPEVNLGTWVVLLGTLAINLFVTRYEAARAKALRSTFLASDAAHTWSDVLVTCGVLVSLVFVRLGQGWLDPIATCAIAVFILITGVRVISENLDYLMDSARVDVTQVQDIVRRIAGVASAHKIRTRGTPSAIRIDLHIQIAPHLNVRHAHEVTHWVIDALRRDIDGVHDVVVHTEPAPDDAAYPELPERMRR
jgi:cation diffusion facilitator family transporter